MHVFAFVLEDFYISKDTIRLIFLFLWHANVTNAQKSVAAAYFVPCSCSLSGLNAIIDNIICSNLSILLDRAMAAVDAASAKIVIINI